MKISTDFYGKNIDIDISIFEAFDDKAWQGQWGANKVIDCLYDVIKEKLPQGYKVVRAGNADVDYLKIEKDGNTIDIYYDEMIMVLLVTLNNNLQITI